MPVSTIKVYRRDTPLSLRLEKRKYYSVLLEDESVKVEYDDLVSGIVRHGKFVRVDEREMFRIEGPRTFSIIGFASKNKIPEYYMRGEGTFYVMPDPESTNDSCQAIYNLVDILAEQKKYAIAKRVYSANNKPKYFVLIPQPDFDPKRFVMAELPYADDVKTAYNFGDVAEITSVKEEEEDDDVFTQFFDAMDVSNPNCKVDIPISPKLMLNPHISKLINLVATKYLKRDFDFDAVDLNLGDSLSEDCDSTEFIEALKASWPESEVIKEEDDGGNMSD